MVLYQQAMDAATALARLSWPIEGSQAEELEDFHSELAYQAAAIHDYVAIEMRYTFRPDWFGYVEDVSWSRLAEDFGYKLNNTKPLTTYLDRFYRAVVDAERYHDTTLDPDDLEANADALNRHYQYSYVVVPVLRYCFAVADIYAVFQEFGAALNALAQYSQHARQKGRHNGKEPFPSDTEAREIVWHATTAYHDILNHGFKTQEELQFSAPGLGGAVDGVSFTSDYRFAQAILLFFQYVVKAINGPRSVEALCGLAEELGLPCDAILDQYAGNYRDLRKTPDKVPPGQAAEFVNQMFWYGGFKRKLINPVAGVGGDTLAERFAGKQMHDLGIIEATVDTTDPAVSYVHAEDEWRVPVKSILSFGPVGSQTRKKTAGVVRYQGAVYRMADVDPTIQALKRRYAQDGQPYVVSALTTTAWRCGSVDKAPRGIFFSADRQGAEAYATFHTGHEPRQYEISVGKTLVAGHQTDVTKMFFGRSYGDLMDQYLYRYKGSAGAAKFDARIKNEAKRQGFAAIVYTAPAPPAGMEICVFDPRDVRPLDSDEAIPERTERLAERYEDVGFTETGRWGNQGSGILFTTGEKILLLRRSSSVEEPGTWGIPGGAVPQTSRSTFRDPYVSAKQETREELGTLPTHQVVDQYVYQEDRFRYTTYVAKVSAMTAQRFRPTLNWENDDAGWFTRDELQDLDLHFGVVELLRHVDPFF